MTFTMPLVSRYKDSFKLVTVMDSRYRPINSAVVTGALSRN